MSETSKITLKDVAERKEAKRLSLSDGRYVTRGNPKSGGLSSVYRATDIETSSMVALKVFRSEGSTDEVIEESFRREAQALSDLKHPHIVRILDSGRDDENGVHFVVMEWVERDLGAVMAPGQYANWEAYYRANTVRLGSSCLQSPSWQLDGGRWHGANQGGLGCWSPAERLSGCQPVGPSRAGRCRACRA